MLWGQKWAVYTASRGLEAPLQLRWGAGEAVLKHTRDPGGVGKLSRGQMILILSHGVCTAGQASN